MAKSKKPRRPYKPKYDTLGHTLFRQSAKSDLYINILGHQAVQSIRDGTATPEDLGAIQFKINWSFHALTTVSHINHREEALDILHKANTAAYLTMNRHIAAGAPPIVSCTMEVHDAFLDAVNVSDDLLKILTRTQSVRCLTLAEKYGMPLDFKHEHYHAP